MSRPKGSKLSDEHKKRIASALRGNRNTLARKKNNWKWSTEAKERRSKQWDGKTWGKKTQFIKGIVAWNKGKKMPDSMREKMKKIASERIGEKSANWNGGLSFLPYLPAFNAKLKLFIRNRDNFTCQLCFVKECDYFQKLSVNHIDYDKTNNSESNLITLCRSCNAKVNFQREKWTKFFSEKIA